MLGGNYEGYHSEGERVHTGVEHDAESWRRRKGSTDLTVLSFRLIRSCLEQVIIWLAIVGHVFRGKLDT